MRIITFGPGAADNDILVGIIGDTVVGDGGVCPDLSRFDIFMIQSTHACDVEGSLDGRKTTASTPLQLEDQSSTTPATRVVVTAANRLYRIAPGCKFTGLRVRSAGANAVTGFLLLARSAGD